MENRYQSTGWLLSPRSVNFVAKTVGGADDSVAREAYRSLMVLTLRDRSADAPYLRFIDELEEWGRNNPRYPRESLRKPGYYLLAYHDAVLLPAIAASLQKTDDVSTMWR